MNILDDNQEVQPLNTEYTQSPELQRKIQKLIDEDQAQKGRTWSFYEKLRKENPNLYRTAKTHEQMVQDAMALGDDFKDGNYDD